MNDPEVVCNECDKPESEWPMAHKGASFCSPRCEKEYYEGVNQ